MNKITLEHHLQGELTKLRRRVADLETEEARYAQAIVEIRETAEKYRRFVENAREGIWAIDNKAVTTFVNPRMAEMLGYTAGEMVGKRLLSFVADPDIEPATRYLEHHKQRVSQRQDFAFRRKDGTIVFTSLYTSPIINNKGDYSGMIAFVEDITERRWAEEALRRSEEYSATILNNSPTPILVANRNSSIRYVNPAFEALTGFSLLELIGQQAPYPWWPEETSDKILERYKQAIRHGVKAREELFRKKNGENFWVEVTATPVIMDGEFRYYLSSWVDITEHKQAEEALHLRAHLLNEATDSIIATDMKGDIIYMNEATCRALGYSKEKLLTMNLKQLGPPETAILIDERLKRVKKEGTIAFESERIHKDGRVYPVEITARNVSLGNQKMILSVIRDITERKKAEEDIRKFKVIADNAEYGVSIADMEGELIYTNDSYARMHGYTVEELIGQNVFLLYPEDQQDFMKNRRKTILEISSAGGELIRLKKDGTTFPTISVGTLVKDNEGRPLYIASSHFDLTGRKKAEEALRESEERYRALLELGERIGEAVVMLQDDERGTAMHVYASDEWSRITGYSNEELLNMSMLDLIHPINRKDATRRHKKRLRGEILPGLYESTIIRKDGSKIPIEGTYAYSSYKGKPANVGYIRDISERKKMDEQLIVTDRLASIGELASGVAHELNNPLTGIIGFSELLLKKDVPEDIREDLKIINREAQRTSQVVRNLLTFARKHDTTKKPVDINKAIQSVLDIRAYEQHVHNIEVVTDFDASLPEITADIFRLQQVFVNIIINAEYFMVQAHGRGKLTITTKREGDIIRASFADDGPGVKEEHMVHLFDPFFTTKEVGKGTGLGLSICHGIVTEHGGNIYAESQLNEGATFIVELPIK